MSKKNSLISKRLKEYSTIYIKMKYICAPCNFGTDNKTKYSRHLATNKHKNVNNKPSYKCEQCNFNTNNNSNFKKHCGTKNHIAKTVKEGIEINQDKHTYECVKCNYKTNNSSDFGKHNKSAKHMTHGEQMGTYNCLCCFKTYKFKSLYISHLRTNEHKEIKKQMNAGNLQVGISWIDTSNSIKNKIIRTIREMSREKLKPNELKALINYYIYLRGLIYEKEIKEHKEYNEHNMNDIYKCVKEYMSCYNSIIVIRKLLKSENNQKFKDIHNKERIALEEEIETLKLQKDGLSVLVDNIISIHMNYKQMDDLTCEGIKPVVISAMSTLQFMSEPIAGRIGVLQGELAEIKIDYLAAKKIGDVAAYEALREEHIEQSKKLKEAREELKEIDNLIEEEWGTDEVEEPACKVKEKGEPAYKKEYIQLFEFTKTHYKEGEHDDIIGELLEEKPRTCDQYKDHINEYKDFKRRYERDLSDSSEED
jgi:hypothetical protein